MRGVPVDESEKIIMFIQRKKQEREQTRMKELVDGPPALLALGNSSPAESGGDHHRRMMRKSLSLSIIGGPKVDTRGPWHSPPKIHGWRGFAKPSSDDGRAHKHMSRGDQNALPKPLVPLGELPPEDLDVFVDLSHMLPGA